MKKFYTCQQVADLLCVKVATVWGWARKGKIEAVKINARDFRIPCDALDAFIASRTNGTL